MAQNPRLPSVPGMPWPVAPRPAAGGPSQAKKLKTSEEPLSVASTVIEEQYSDDEEKRGGGGKQTTEAKRFQHCEVEKRRRERMNRYMNELAQMVPACSAVPRRLDKLSILKMAVEHMKSLRGDPHSSNDHRPGFLTDDELKHLVVEAANGFMVIIECSLAHVLFVSDTISDVLGESPQNWIGTCFYDLLHPKDVSKVKGQLACFDLDEALKASIKNNSNNSPLLMHTQSLNGLRRSFLCRVKRERSSPDTVECSGRGAEGAEVDYQRSEDVIRLFQSTQHSTEQQYAVLHCTGFIRNLTSAEQQTLKVEENSSGMCLIAIARLQHFGGGTSRSTLGTSENEFVSRVGTDGRYTYVDPRVMGVLGYLPQDLIGQVSYEYYHPEDIQKMVQLHHDAMKRRTPMPTVHYRFLSRQQQWVWLAMKAFSFLNPFSQQVEYVVCTNVAMRMSDDGDSVKSTSTITASTITAITSSTPPLTLTPALPPSPPADALQQYASPSLPPSHPPTHTPSHPPTHTPSQPTPTLPTPSNLTPFSISSDDPLASFFHDITSSAADMSQPSAITAVPTASSSSSSFPSSPPPPSIVEATYQTRGASSLVPSSSLPPPSIVEATYQTRGASSLVPSSSLSSSFSSYALNPSGPVLTTPATTTLEENAAAAQKVLEQYRHQMASPQQRKDMNYDFPPELFPSEHEVDLEGSQQAYQILQQGMERPDMFLDLFVQVEADPFQQQHIFGDIDFDIFD